MKLKDSGARREFPSGAVRDIAEGKGRCDLLPLHEVADFLDDAVISVIADAIDYKAPYMLHTAIRIFSKDRGWHDWDAMLEVSKHYEDGCLKYGEKNWMKGIPCHCFLDSAIRHYFKYKRGDTDEPHDRAFIWNILGLIWTLNNKPELNDIWVNELQ